MICNTCKRYFKLEKENRYEVVKSNGLSGAFSGNSKTVYECFDCPKCGCQNIVHIREKNEENKEKTLNEIRAEFGLPTIKGENND